MFLALVEGERGGMEAVEVVERIADSFRAPLVVEQCEIFTSVSIGIAFYPENGKTYEEVVRNADRAMACAKSEGKNTYRFSAFDDRGCFRSPPHPQQLPAGSGKK